MRERERERESVCSPPSFFSPFALVHTETAFVVHLALNIQNEIIPSLIPTYDCGSKEGNCTFCS